MARLDVARLEALGFFRHVRPQDLVHVRRAVAESPFGVVKDLHRAHFVDAESLAERGVLDFLSEVAPFLRKEGVPIEVVYKKVKFPARGGRPPGQGAAELTAEGWIDPEGPRPAAESLRVAFAPGAPLCEITEDDFEVGGTYLLFAGEREIVIYDEQVDVNDAWEHTVQATIALLDELLSAHGSAERAHALFSGSNDLTIVFATPEMANILNAAASSPRERLHRSSPR